MRRDGGLTMLRAARDSVMLCCHRERRDNDGQFPDAAAEQQQADEKQQVVGTDQDVILPQAERVDDGQDTLAGAGEVLEAGLVVVENRLRERSVLVDVDEGLVRWIVWKEGSRYRNRARRVIDGESNLQLERLPLRENLRSGPGGARRSAVNQNL